MSSLASIWNAWPGPDLAVTWGPWPDERAAEDELVAFLEASRLFVVYRQVVGRPLWTHCFQAPQGVRADLLLIPSERLLKAGWEGGAIVIEVKRPGEKIGPGCSQLIDYMNSAWRLPESGGVMIVPSFGFLFPARKQQGPLASVMAHQHVGTACLDHDWLHCWCGESRVLSITAAGNVRLGRLDFGHRVGAR
jgi:hypothetical protein